MDKITKQYLVQKMFDRWVKDNPNAMEDIAELANLIMMIHIKWGIKFKVDVEKD